MARSSTATTAKIGNTSFAGVNSAGTISIWLQPNWNAGDGVQHPFWSFGSFASSSDLPSFQKFSDNNIYCGFSGSGNDQRIVVADTGLFTSGSWANWIFTWSNGAGQTLYKGAASKGTHALTFPTTGAQYEVFYFTPGGGGISTGAANIQAADLAYWNVILSAGEISALAKGARPNTIRPANLGLWLPLDGLQSPEPDLSSNALNGTLSGSPTLAAGPPINMFTPRWPQFSAVAAVTTKPFPPFQLRAA